MNLDKKENVEMGINFDNILCMRHASHFSLNDSCTHFVATLALEDLSHVCFTSFDDYGVMNDSVNYSFISIKLYFHVFTQIHLA